MNDAKCGTELDTVAGYYCWTPQTAAADAT